MKETEIQKMKYVSKKEQTIVEALAPIENAPSVDVSSTF